MGNEEVTINKKFSFVEVHRSPDLLDLGEFVNDSIEQHEKTMYVVADIKYAVCVIPAEDGDEDGPTMEYSAMILFKDGLYHG